MESYDSTSLELLDTPAHPERLAKFANVRYCTGKNLHSSTQLDADVKTNMTVVYFKRFIRTELPVILKYNICQTND